MENARIRQSRGAFGTVKDADADLNAWAYLDENAMTPHDESVAAWPFGVKDVIDVRGMPTRCGLDFIDEHPGEDAACVAALRRAGGVPIGKTQTTPMMWRDPAPTRNPHDPSRTPGGSSSGSAAAVGAGHVDVALATQTLGSILRPASFCGVVGFKPTFGRVSRAGVTPLSPSLDHVGIIARDVDAASRAMRALDASIVHESIRRPYRIAIDSSAFEDVYGSDARAAVAACGERLAAAGVDVVATPLGDVLAPFFETVCTIAAHEALDTVAPRIAGQDAPPHLRALIETGRALGASAYDDVLERRERATAAYRGRTSGFDIVCFVTAGGAPPRTSTGNGSAQAPASAMGLPAITLPSGRDREGLPLGVQFVAPLGADGMLLEFAAWAESQLAAREPSTR